jgi:hypothetical protein
MPNPSHYAAFLYYNLMTRNVVSGLKCHVSNYAMFIILPFLLGTSNSIKESKT